jgi:ATP-dependent DNA ligase
MDLPVSPSSMEPMLARLTRRLPEGEGLVYEPKWDGFRCLAFRAGAELDLRSRNGRPLARYFPELVDALSRVPDERFVLDGEIVGTSHGRPDFTALLARLHPAASRVAALARAGPACFIAFDVVALGEEDLREVPFAERRARLERLLRTPPGHVMLTPATVDRDLAARWLEGIRSGVDGVVAKPPGLRYQPGRRAMVKVKRERTADCVVAGFRVFADEDVVASLLLGLFDERGGLQHVGVASSFTEARRRELARHLRPLAAPLRGHAWEQGFGAPHHFGNRLAGGAGRWTPNMELDWIPVGPGLVCEVAYDHWDGDRFRYPARLLRWRPDRSAASCTFEQFGAAEGAALPDVARR